MGPFCYVTDVRLHAEAHAYLKWNNEEKPRQKVALTSAPIRVQVVAQPIVAWGPERLIESAHPRLYVAAAVNALKTSTHKTAQQDSAVLAGARGVIEKRESPALLLKALESVHEGRTVGGARGHQPHFSELARQKTAKEPNPEAERIASLTLRERQAIAALASDATAPGKVIAERLHISEHTLRNHLTVIYSKLGVPNRLALYAYARANGLSEAV